MKPWDIVAWYSDNVAKRKLAKAEIGYVLGRIKNLNKDYSLEDIMYALVWTANNKRNMTGFGLVAYTIEEALADRRRQEELSRLRAQLPTEPLALPSIPQIGGSSIRPKPKWMRGQD